MSKEEAISKLKECQNQDPETGHVDADLVLCELLKTLGHEDVVAEFQKVHKWYA